MKPPSFSNGRCCEHHLGQQRTTFACSTDSWTLAVRSGMKHSWRTKRRSSLLMLYGVGTLFRLLSATVALGPGSLKSHMLAVPSLKGPIHTQQPFSNVVLSAQKSRKQKRTGRQPRRKSPAINVSSFVVCEFEGIRSRHGVKSRLNTNKNTRRTLRRMLIHFRNLTTETARSVRKLKSDSQRLHRLR